jgi:hypothetical protein
MNHKTKYRLAVGEAQQRLAELSQCDATDLRDEIGLCRLMLESAANDRSPAAIALLQTLGKLSAADLQNRIRRHDLLTREEALKFVQEMCAIVSEEIQTLDGFEDVLDRIADRIAHGKKALPQLEYEHVG